MNVRAEHLALASAAILLMWLGWALGAILWNRLALRWRRCPKCGAYWNVDQPAVTYVNRQAAAHLPSKCWRCCGGAR